MLCEVQNCGIDIASSGTGALPEGGPRIGGSALTTRAFGSSNCVGSSSAESGGPFRRSMRSVLTLSFRPVTSPRAMLALSGFVQLRFTLIHVQSKNRLHQACRIKRLEYLRFFTAG